MKAKAAKAPHTNSLVICFFLVENTSIRPLAVWSFFVSEIRLSTLAKKGVSLHRHSIKQLDEKQNHSYYVSLIISTGWL